MSEFDEIIASIAKNLPQSKAGERSCKKTLADYQCLDTADVGTGGSGPLKMIAWDRV